MPYSKNIDTVLQILTDEVKGDVASALKKMADDYEMTWVYKSQDTLFPKTNTKNTNVAAEMREVYAIEDREYHVMNIGEGKNVVMVELIETYTDPNTKQIHNTPLVLVLTLQNGKIKTGRHYCDPRISYESLSVDQMKNILFEKESIQIIK